MTSSGTAAISTKDPLCQAVGSGVSLTVICVAMLTELDISKDLEVMFKRPAAEIQILLQQQLAQVEIKGLMAQVRDSLLCILIADAGFSRSFSLVASHKVHIW